MVSGTRVACPWHGWMFDVRTGQCLFPTRGGAVPSYPVRIDGDQVWVDLGVSALYARAGACLHRARRREARRELGFRVAIAVVDDAGHLVACDRMDGALWVTPEIARAKANAAAGFHATTLDLEERFSKRMLFADNVATLGDYAFVFGRGGVPVVDGRSDRRRRRRQRRRAGRQRSHNRRRGRRPSRGSGQPLSWFALSLAAALTQAAQFAVVKGAAAPFLRSPSWRAPSWWPSAPGSSSSCSRASPSRRPDRRGRPFRPRRCSCSGWRACSPEPAPAVTSQSSVRSLR